MGASKCAEQGGGGRGTGYGAWPMTRLLLVRHARPTENWDAAPDAGLDAHGRGQAEALVGVLGSDAALAVLTSPLRRARETAAPLAAHWGCEPQVLAAGQAQSDAA